MNKRIMLISSNPLITDQALMVLTNNIIKSILDRFSITFLGRRDDYAALGTSVLSSLFASVACKTQNDFTIIK